MTKIQNTEHWMPARVWSHQELLLTAAGNAKCCSHVARQFGGFFHNCTRSHRKIRRSCSLAFIQRRWTYVHTETCTRMFVAASFVIAGTWKQLKCSPLGEWVKTGPSRQWDIIQREKEVKGHEEPSVHVTKWKSQSEKAAYCVVLTTWRSAKGRTVETVKRPVVIRGWGRVKDE